MSSRHAASSGIVLLGCVLGDCCPPSGAVCMVKPACCWSSRHSSVRAPAHPAPGEADITICLGQRSALSESSAFGDCASAVLLHAPRIAMASCVDGTACARSKARCRSSSASHGLDK
eukprot:CAMPEP_0179406622 /NCGR_PEP_ID=MMETSP0799-20121207/999_1 /TAXON_ID=46947 /ORGANISM="Geminigera cryophila, Strain CCMP2564" /LENGTH=116 /DNA_ID=CAMNT_0021177711 /DNA_START=61 /DNA_END=411 /DNA_ORIENTATION=-